MKLLISFLLMICLNARAGEKGAYLAMTAGNRIEREIQWAWQQLPRFIYACSFSADCGLNEDQKTLARSIWTHRDQYSLNSLVFISEKTRPDLFQASNGETHRLATTGNTPDSPIYINTEQESKLGKSRGLSFWMGILAHELTHHLGVQDDQRRIPDQFGALMAQAGDKFLVSIPVPEDSRDIMVSVLNPPAPSTSQVLQGFPEGVWFHMLKQDDAMALDDQAMLSMKQQGILCKDKTLVSIRVSPEPVQITDDPRDATIARVQVGLNAQLICADLVAKQVTRQEPALVNVFEAKKKPRLTLDVQTYSSWGEADPAGPTGHFENAMIVNWQVPDSVKAGEVLRISAEVKARDGLNFVGCSAYISSDSWPRSVIGSAPVVVPDRCVYKKIGPQTYSMTLEKDISPAAAAVQLHVENLSLNIVHRTAPCIPAYPIQKKLIQVINPNPGPDIAVTDFNLGGVREISKEANQIRFEYSADKSFFVTFTLKNASGLESGVFDTGILTRTGNDMGLQLPFTEANAIVVNRTLTPLGRDLAVRLEFKWGPAGPDIDIIQGRFENLQILTPDFHSLFINLLSQNLSVQIAGVKP